MTKNIMTGAAREAVRILAVKPLFVTVNYEFPMLIAGFIPGLSNATIPLTSATICAGNIKK